MSTPSRFQQLLNEYSLSIQPTAITTITTIHSMNKDSIFPLHPDYQYFGNALSVNTYGPEMLRKHFMTRLVIAPTPWFVATIARPGDMFDYSPLRNYFDRERPSEHFHIRYGLGLSDSGFICLCESAYKEFMTRTSLIPIKVIPGSPPQGNFYLRQGNIETIHSRPTLTH